MSEQNPDPSDSDNPDHRPLPLLFKNLSFHSFLATQALGAFNDNVFKQLVLLLGVGFMMVGVEYQAVVQALFALPFLLFSGLAGDLSDRFSKSRMIVACKVAEVIIALLGVVGFLMVNSGSGNSTDAPLYLWFLAAVAFLLGTQSAFFGPAKYGGLPEFVRQEDLAQATGLTQMTTFLAIIFGVALAGLLADLLADRLYLAGLVTVSIAVLGTLTALGIRHIPATDPERRITARSLVSVIPTLSTIFRSDHLMMLIMVLYSWFWFVGGVALTAINAYGRFQLGLNNFETSLMVATISIGIAVGSVLVGRLSAGKVRLGLVVPALIALVLLLIAITLVPVYNPTAAEIEHFNLLKEANENVSQIIPEASQAIKRVTGALFFLMGIASGFFSVPLLTFIQARPPLSEKGRVFAAVNWLNWVFILAAALAYGGGMALFDNRASLMFGALGLATLVVGLLLFPAIFRIIERERPSIVFRRDTL